MMLSDVSSLSHGERYHHYLDSWGGEDMNRRAAISGDAAQQANAEMLDEIHTMLRHLCKIEEPTP